MKKTKSFIECLVLGALVMAYARGAFAFMDEVAEVSNKPIMIPVMIILGVISFALAGYFIMWLVTPEKTKDKRW